ncbi:ROK family protein [Hydrocarboniphaga sp.]|uniref:ROK family protein n=1 Tax=Hydrocarboniphaga sp. TaxID=2033016 RepID=UPI003D0EAA5C
MRIGIDLGGTKIEGVVMAPDSQLIAKRRVATPRGDYAATLAAVAQVVADLETEVAARGLPVGVAHPGALSQASGRLKNSNSTCLNDQPLQADLERALQREVRMANDANCLALSEAVDGAAAGASSVFAAILGTGAGAGVVINGALLQGANSIAGEWGHNGLPRPKPEWNETPGPACWCGRHGCIETWLSGPALADDHARNGGERISGETIVALAEAGDARASASLSRYEDRLARSLSQVINLLDPDVIVLGGGLSRIERLYRHVPALWDEGIFSDTIATRLLPALHGDSSGVRGAARLWPAG